MTPRLPALPALAALAAATALAAPRPALAGVVLKWKDRNGESAEMSLDGNRMRMERPGRRDVMVFDGDAQRMLLVNPEKRTYAVMDEAMAREAGERMEKQMANLPPAVRERLQAMGAAKRAAPEKHRWSIEPTGETGTAAGRSCRTYRILRDGKADEDGGRRSEICLVPWGSGYERRDFAAWAAMAKFSQKLMGAMAGGLGRTAAPQGAPGGIASWLADAPGFPGRDVSIDAGGKRTVDWELTSIERRSIPGDRFAPPAGYRETPMLGEPAGR